MAEVRPLQDLTPSEDGCFAFVDRSSNVSINYLTPNGTAEYTDFECYEHSAGTIIKFGSELPRQDVATPWSLNVVLDSSTCVLQWATYEEHYDAWENIDRSPHRFYSFMESIDTSNFASMFVSKESRCDFGAYGPLPYYSVTDGIRQTVADPALFAKTRSADYLPVIGINGLAYITSSYMHGINMSWRNWPMVTFTGKTLSGLVKQLSEWKSLYDAGVVSEKYAKDASQFIDSLGITTEMIDELRQTEVIMPTERFMRGYGNPRHGFTETGVFPQSIRDVLMKQLRFKTLTVLEAKHPLRPSIDQELKDAELDTQRQRILQWFFEFRPSLPVEDMSPQALYEHVFNREPTVAVVAPVDANKHVYRNGLLAARFFDATEQ